MVHSIPGKVLCVLIFFYFFIILFFIFVLYVNLDIFVQLTLANYLKNVQVI